MRKSVVTLLFVALLVVAVATVWADNREKKNIEMYFGASFHKSPAGVHLNYLQAKWDENGLNYVQYQITPWKGITTYKDMYVVNKGQVLYKLSKDRQLNVQMSYQLTAQKNYLDHVYLNPTIKPFDYENSEIWWIVGFKNEGKEELVAVIWHMKDNKLEWKPFKEQPPQPPAQPTPPAPPAATPAPSAPPAPPAAPPTPPKQ